MNTKYWLNTIARNVFKVGGGDGLPEKLYLGLSTKHPNADGGNVEEPKTGGYQRVELKSLKMGADGHVTNSEDIRFPESTDSQGVVTDWVLFDAESDGNLLEFDYFRKGGEGENKNDPVTRTIEAGTVLVVRANSVDLWFKDDTVPSAG